MQVCHWLWKHNDANWWTLIEAKYTRWKNNIKERNILEQFEYLEPSQHAGQTNLEDSVVSNKSSWKNVQKQFFQGQRD